MQEREEFQMKRTFFKRLAAVVATLALLTGTLCTAAFAAGTANTVKEKTGTGAIHVTVKDQDPAATPGDGTQNNSVSGTPVSGVGINALRIGNVVELTTTDGGSVTTQVAFGIRDAQIKNLLGLGAQASLAEDAGVTYYKPETVQKAVEDADQATVETYLNEHKDSTGTTDNYGSANFTNLNYGLYLLAKSELPAESTTDLVPFLVSLPMYQEASRTWSGDVYAYPKVRTSQITLTKSANLQYVAGTDTVAFRIDISIPAAKSTEATALPFTKFVLNDVNENNTLTVDETSLTVSGMGTDGYTFDKGSSTLTFTGAGLAVLNQNLTTDQTITITYNATLTQNSTFASKLTNVATLDYQRQDSQAGTAKSNTVALYTYGLHLKKTLSDAKDTIQTSTISFALYQNADCQQKIASTSPSQNSSFWVTAGTPSGQMYVDTNGDLYIYGVKPGTYYLKEESTQSGYTLLEKPIEIVIGADVSEGAGEGAITATVNGGTAQVTDGIVSLTVENTKSVLGFTLPKTGGSGTLLATALGLGLLALAVVLLVLYRKKNHEQ